MRRSTTTVTVFFILSLTTRPVSCRLVVASLMSLSLLVISGQHGAHARDVRRTLRSWLVLVSCCVAFCMRRLNCACRS